jgi:hypothetical protein
MHLLVAAVIALAPGIRSPSGNIACFASRGSLHCDIAQAVYRPALQQQCQKRAGLDWHGFELSTRYRGAPSCSGGTLGTARYRTLAYGTTWHAAPFTCTSRITGMTCTAGTHGLFIARQTWRGW